MPIEKLAIDATFDAARFAAAAVKDTWSVLDAAAEKPAPSRYLGAKAVQAIQGVTDQAQKIAGAAVQAAN
jgi:hypothetical protein